MFRPVKTAVSTYKKAKLFVVTLWNHRFVELQAEILDLKRQLNEAETKRQALVTEVEGLRRSNSAKLTFKYDRNAYWSGPKRVESEDGPWCATCWDNRRVQARLGTQVGLPDAYCSQCKTFAEVWPERHNRPRAEEGREFI